MSKCSLPTLSTILQMYFYNAFVNYTKLKSKLLPKQQNENFSKESFLKDLKLGLSNEGFFLTITVQKMKFSNQDFSSKCDQICSFLRIWSHLLEKSLMGNFIFSAVHFNNKFEEILDYHAPIKQKVSWKHKASRQ